MGFLGTIAKIGGGIIGGVVGGPAGAAAGFKVGSAIAGGGGPRPRFPVGATPTAANLPSPFRQQPLTTIGGTSPLSLQASGCPPGQRRVQSSIGWGLFKTDVCKPVPRAQVAVGPSGVSGTINQLSNGRPQAQNIDFGTTEKGCQCNGAGKCAGSNRLNRTGYWKQAVPGDPTQGAIWVPPRSVCTSRRTMNAGNARAARRAVRRLRSFDRLATAVRKDLKKLARGK